MGEDEDWEWSGCGRDWPSVGGVKPPRQFLYMELDVRAWATMRTRHAVASPWA
jgi:hypothetical protein